MMQNTTPMPEQQLMTVKCNSGCGFISECYYSDDKFIETANVKRGHVMRVAMNFFYSYSGVCTSYRLQTIH